eukprot:PhM_4_TR6329/c0_g1_i1/m.1931/K05697/PTPN6, SHP-1; tyrosine-protein phosphatase non-receptor type 6
MSGEATQSSSRSLIPSELVRAFEQKVATLFGKSSAPCPIDDEYHCARRIDAQCSRTPNAFTAALHPDNASRNRFTNILANETTRVRLSSATYVNANHIPSELFNVPYSYIMSQAPLSTTIQDFYTMIWEHNVSCVVQLNNDAEMFGHLKGYLPRLGQEPLQLPDGFHVSVTSECEAVPGVVLQRNVSLTFNSAAAPPSHRTLLHLQFLGWPDHGVPQGPEGVVELMTTLESLVPAGRPVLVHCMAGVGRTGTFISTHIAAQLARQGRLLVGKAHTPSVAAAASGPPPSAAHGLCVQDIVETIKASRTGSVQGAAQYAFVYRGILHWMKKSVA